MAKFSWTWRIFGWGDVWPFLLLAAVLVLAGTPGHCSIRNNHAHKRNHKPYTQLFPTAGSMLAQNAEANRLGLPRIKNPAMLAELVSDGSLVPLPEGASLNLSLPRDRAYLRPWAAVQLGEIAQAFYQATGKPLRVDSAVRPLTVQRRLLRWCRAAAPVAGPVASVHPTGIAFDLQRHGLTPGQLKWLQWRLFYEQALGRVIVEEEAACFHVVALSDAPSRYNVDDERTVPTNLTFARGGSAGHAIEVAHADRN